MNRNNTPRISLIVPSYNRSQYLKKSLPTFINQSIHSSLYEILIIDNNSNDNTRAVVYDAMNEARVQWRYVFEERQGLHYARNRGILESSGDIIVFGDDDIEATENWLKYILREYDSNERAGIVGGKVLPRWVGNPPEWIYDYGDAKIHGVFAYLDKGDSRKSIDDAMLFGCNFSIRKKLAIEIGGSPPDTFPKKLKHLSGMGETEMLMRVAGMGYDIIYLPEAIVFHHADAGRATLEYFIDRYERWAVERVYHNFRYDNTTGGKYRVFIGVVIDALKKIINAKKLGKNKINPEYFTLIHIKSAIMQFKQAVRVLFFKSLYGYIKKENYFK